MSDTTDTPAEDAPVENPADAPVLADDAPPEADVLEADQAVEPDAADEAAVDEEIIPAAVIVEVDRDLLPGFFTDEVTLPAGVEETFKPSVQVHEYRGRTLTLNKVTMSANERTIAIANFEAAIDAEDGIEA